MPSRFRLTVEADTLAELTGALTDAASHLQAGDASAALAVELAPLAAPAPTNGLPLPPPDYVAAGLTAHQAANAAAYAAQPANAAQAAASMLRPPEGPPWPIEAPALAPPSPMAAAGSIPICRIHQREMVWKGGGLSKSGKGLPLWSCADSQCREAIWPPRA